MAVCPADRSAYGTVVGAIVVWAQFYPECMGKVMDGIDDALASWISAQPMWFVATAPLAIKGRVNVSHRGHDSFSILGAHQVGWVDYTGSGVATIAHLRENGRICVMFASFDHRPRIVRLHGHGIVASSGEAAYEKVVALNPAHPATRAVVVDIERVSDSCGYGVPVMDFVEERDLLRLNAQKKGPEAMESYRAQKNTASIDGLPGL